MGVVVYVGSTQDPIERWRAHEQLASPYLVDLRQWIDANPHTFAVVGSYDSKRNMLDAERLEIERLKPIFNRRYNDIPAAWPMNEAQSFLA